VGLVRVNVDGETEVGRQVAAYLLPRIAGVFAAHDVPVLLHEEHTGTRRVHRDAVNAVADLGRRVGDAFRLEAPVYGSPGFSGIRGPEGARRRDRDEHPLAPAWIQKDGVKTQAAGAGLPVAPGLVTAQSGQLLPILAAVRRAKQGGVFDSGVHEVGIGQR